MLRGSDKSAAIKLVVGDFQQLSYRFDDSSTVGISAANISGCQPAIGSQQSTAADG
jgi:hypothetical protein